MQEDGRPSPTHGGFGPAIIELSIKCIVEFCWSSCSLLGIGKMCIGRRPLCFLRLVPYQQGPQFSPRILLCSSERAVRHSCYQFLPFVNLSQRLIDLALGHQNNDFGARAVYFRFTWIATVKPFSSNVRSSCGPRPGTSQQPTSALHGNPEKPSSTYDRQISRCHAC